MSSALLPAGCRCMAFRMGRRACAFGEGVTRCVVRSWQLCSRRWGGEGLAQLDVVGVLLKRQFKRAQNTISGSIPAALLRPSVLGQPAHPSIPSRSSRYRLTEAPALLRACFRSAYGGLHAHVANAAILTSRCCVPHSFGLSVTASSLESRAETVLIQRSFEAT